MSKATLVVLAAGMGSRYGGLKQIDPIGPNGEVILELSAFDAIKAGFDRIVFIIKKEIEKDFKEAIGDKISKAVEVEYVFQDIHALPEGYSVPEGRVKPWGTAHALLCCKDVLDGPFAVINADDYYGQTCFQSLYDFLVTNEEENQYAMIGYVLSNTLTDNGTVARGVCILEDGKLAGVRELTKIGYEGDKVVNSENGESEELDPQSLVSMNMWGFTTKFVKEVENRFVNFLETTAKEDPMKGEFYIPKVVDALIREGSASVKVMSSQDKWYGVTYQEDKPMVKEGIKSLMDRGLYPEKLWEK